MLTKQMPTKALLKAVLFPTLVTFIGFVLCLTVLFHVLTFTKPPWTMGTLKYLVFLHFFFFLRIHLFLLTLINADSTAIITGATVLILMVVIAVEGASYIAIVMPQVELSLISSSPISLTSPSKTTIGCWWQIIWLQGLPFVWRSRRAVIMQEPVPAFSTLPINIPISLPFMLRKLTRLRRFTFIKRWSERDRSLSVKCT